MLSGFVALFVNSLQHQSFNDMSLQAGVSVRLIWDRNYYSSYTGHRELLIMTPLWICVHIYCYFTTVSNGPVNSCASSMQVVNCLLTSKRRFLRSLTTLITADKNVLGQCYGAKYPKNHDSYFLIFQIRCCHLPHTHWNVMPFWEILFIRNVAQLTFVTRKKNRSQADYIRCIRIGFVQNMA